MYGIEIFTNILGFLFIFWCLRLIQDIGRVSSHYFRGGLELSVREAKWDKTIWSQDCVPVFEKWQERFGYHLSPHRTPTYRSTYTPTEPSFLFRSRPFCWPYCFFFLSAWTQKFVNLFFLFDFFRWHALTLFLNSTIQISSADLELSD